MDGGSYDLDLEIPISMLLMCCRTKLIPKAWMLKPRQGGGLT